MGGLHFRLGYKSVQVHTKETYYGEPLMGRIFHRQGDKHLSCAALGLCGCEQNPGDPQEFCWVRTKLDLTLVVSRFQTLLNRLNRSSLSTQPPTGQAIILFFYKSGQQFGVVQRCRCVPKSYTVGHCFVFKLRYEHRNTVVQSTGKTTVGTKMKTRARPLLAISAVWKYWSVSQAISLFWCFSRYCVDYYWSRSKGWFPGNTFWCSTDVALFAHQFYFLHNLTPWK